MSVEHVRKVDEAVRVLTDKFEWNAEKRTWRLMQIKAALELIGAPNDNRQCAIYGMALKKLTGSEGRQTNGDFFKNRFPPLKNTEGLILCPNCQHLFRK